MHRNLMHLLAKAFAGAKRAVKYGSVVFKEYLFNDLFFCKITFICEILFQIGSEKSQLQFLFQVFNFIQKLQLYSLI